MKNLALFMLFVTLAAALEIESDGKSIEKKQEKRGISGLGYVYGTSGLGGLGGYDNNFGYSSLSNGAYGPPISYSRYTGGYTGGYSGLSGYNGGAYNGGAYNGGGYNGGGYNGGGYNGGYNGGIYNGGYNSGYNNGGYRSGYYNRGGLGYSSLGSGYSGLGYSSDGFSSVYPYARVAGLAGSQYTGYASNGGYVY